MITVQMTIMLKTITMTTKSAVGRKKKWMRKMVTTIIEMKTKQEKHYEVEKMELM